MENLSVSISELFIKKKNEGKSETLLQTLYAYICLVYQTFSSFFSRYMHVNLVIILTKLQIQMDPGLLSENDIRSTLV